MGQATMGTVTRVLRIDSALIFNIINLCDGYEA
jgi:hypothetical protein